jgi:hypothetical protein
MHRERQYVTNSNKDGKAIYTWRERNASNMYHGGFSPAEPAEDVTGTPFFVNPDVATITFTAEKLVLPIPAETLTKTPSMTQEPVDYNF